MSSHSTRTSVHTHQMVVYNRALHPEHFELKARRLVKHEGMELEAWIMGHGTHVLRFGHRGSCACELLTDQHKSPSSGVLAAYPCLGEHDHECVVDPLRIAYMLSIQTETVPESVFQATMREMKSAGETNDRLVLEWSDSAGPCLSVIEFEPFPNQIHAHCYHFLAQGHMILKTSTLFEGR